MSSPQDPSGDQPGAPPGPPPEQPPPPYGAPPGPGAGPHPGPQGPPGAGYTQQSYQGYVAPRKGLEVEKIMLAGAWVVLALYVLNYLYGLTQTDEYTGDFGDRFFGGMPDARHRDLLHGCAAGGGGVAPHAAGRRLSPDPVPDPAPDARRRPCWRRPS